VEAIRKSSTISTSEDAESLGTRFARRKDSLKASEVGNWQQLLENAEKLIEGDPKNINSLNDAGIANSMLGNTEKAIEYYERAIEAAPNDRIPPSLLNNLGNVQVRNGDIERGIKVLLRAVELAPTHSGYLSSLASALYLGEHYEDSKASYEEALALLNSEINNSRSRMTRVNVLLWLEQPQDAAGEVRSLLNEFKISKGDLDGFRFSIERKTKVGVNGADEILEILNATA
jgi:Tfp pilus assembly protein PilF